MLWFLLGVICGMILGMVLANAKPKSAGKETAVKTVVPQVQEMANTIKEGKRTVQIDIPIEIMPNIYSLSVENPTVKYKAETFKDGKTFEHISIDCAVRYNLNGRKEGKRYFVFSYYDQNGNIVSHNETKAYQFTESGMEIVHIEYYVSWADLPKKIGISIRETSR